MAITVNTIRVQPLVTTALYAGLVPILHGSPGIGKSAVMQQIADELNLELIDIRLAQYDPTDLNGFPCPDLERGRSGYLPPEAFPLEGDSIPKGKDGWLLFFDELPSADRSVQKACYKVIYDRMIGNKKLHANVAMAAAGNLASDNALVEEMSTALQSRMVHFEVVSDHTAWIPMAMSKGISHYITDFVKFSPGSLNTFKPDHNDYTFACERTWFFADKLLKQTGGIDLDNLPVFAGTLSEGVAREFLAFTQLYADLPNQDDIIKMPLSVPVPKEPGTLFALTGAIGSWLDETNAPQAIQYVLRLPIEFQAVTLRNATAKNPEFKKVKEVRDWIRTTATELY